MARAVPLTRKVVYSLIGWVLGLVLFFPILWTFLTGFKSAGDAIRWPPQFIFFDWTLETYKEVLERSNMTRFYANTVYASVGSALAGLVIGIPAAWAMAFAPSKRTRFILLWMLSTKMMPAVAVFIPIYLIFRDTGLLDNRHALLGLLTLGNLPIVIWMLFTYFRDIPGEVLDAAKMDGANLKNEIVHILLPMAAPGIAATLLLTTILAWNEAFWTLLLVSVDGATMSTFISSFSAREGNFLALLCAASSLAIAPALVMGWLCQKQLARGLTFGMIK